MSNKDRLPTFREIKEITAKTQEHGEILKKAKVGSNFLYKNEKYAVVEAPSRENDWVCKFEKYFDVDEFAEGTQSEGKLTMKLEVLGKKISEGKMVYLERKAVKPKFEDGKEPVVVMREPKLETSETSIPEKKAHVDSLDEKKYREERKFLIKDTEKILPLLRSVTGDGDIDRLVIKKLLGSLTMSDKYANDILLELEKLEEIERKTEALTSRGKVTMFRIKKPSEIIPQGPGTENTRQEETKESIKPSLAERFATMTVDEILNFTLEQMDAFTEEETQAYSDALEKLQ